jgi:hypothetical protein
MHVPADPVEFETRLGAMERRLAEYEAREQRLLQLIEAVNHLTEAIGPMVKSSRSSPAPAEERRKPDWPLLSPSAGPGGPVAPERIALAHARLRQTLFAGSPAESGGEGNAPAPGAAPQDATPADLQAAGSADAAVAAADVPPPGRKSWLLRSLRRMVKDDSPAAGKLVLALTPAHAFAGLPPLTTLPGPPASLARVLVVGRLRRRIKWEKARLDCPPAAVYKLAPLARMRASVAQLADSGVRPDPALAFSLLAFAVRPDWTAGHQFTIAHRGPYAVTYFCVRGRDLPAVTSDQPPAPVVTTICCLDEALFPVLAGKLPPGVTVLGAIAPLQLMQRWFVRASSG